MKKRDKRSRLSGCAIRAAWLCAALTVCWLSCPLVHQAAEESLAVTLTETVRDTRMYQEPAEEAAVLLEIPSGSTVLVLEESGGIWEHVSCQGIQGYVRKDDLQSAKDQEALDSEFAQLDQQFEDIGQEIREVRRETGQRYLWTAVIVFLIAATGIVWIISRREKGKKTERNQDEE